MSQLIERAVVKKLKWDGLQAVTIYGALELVEDSAGFLCWCSDGSEYGYMFDSPRTKTEAEAKAAVQLAHERRILSALTQPPSPVAAEGYVLVQPLDTKPSGDEALEPDEVNVHEGSWALVIGTNGKPAGWIDTHKLFAHQVYRDQILAARPSIGETVPRAGEWQPNKDYANEATWPPEGHPLASHFHGARLRINGAWERARYEQLIDWLYPAPPLASTQEGEAP